MALTQTPEEGLKVSNAPSDGKFLQYKDSTDKLTWATAGAGSMSNIVEDTTPQLGGDLDIQASKITSSTTNGNIVLDPNGSGVVSVDSNLTLADSKQLLIGDTSDLVIDHTSSHSRIVEQGTGDLQISSNSKVEISTSASNGDIEITPHGTGDVKIEGLKYPQADGSAGQFLKTDGSAQLSWATISSTPEGEAVLSTTNSNEASTKFLRADGDGTCSWQIPPAATATSGTDSFTVSDGNLVIGTAGHGIDFSAQSSASGGSASMDTELLDYYEEGTFTPTMAASTTFTMSHQEGAYVRVGNIVTVYVRVGWSNTNSASGGIKLGGFPYNTKTNSGGYYQTGCFFDFWGFFPDGYSLVYGPGGNNYWYFGTTHGTTQMGTGNIGTGNGGFSISVTYLCND